MAVLDPRVLTLLETLAGIGADCLAFEFVDSVRHGREPLEPEELLQAARERVRSPQLSVRLSADIPVFADPFPGDDQIAWAAHYVAAHLDGILAHLDEGCTMIEAVADNSGDTFRQDDPTFSEATPGVPVDIALVGQESHPIDRGSIAAAREGLVCLRDVLARWSLEDRARLFDDTAAGRGCIELHISKRRCASYRRRRRVDVRALLDGRHCPRPQVPGHDVWLERSDGTPILPMDADRRFM